MDRQADADRRCETQARSGASAGRGHWALPWLLLVAALPGLGWSVYAAMIASAPFFGEQPSPADLATSVAACWSGVSLCLVTAVTAVFLYRRYAVVPLCVLAAAAFVALAGSIDEPGVSLTEAENVGWLAAWTLPTSWPTAVLAVVVTVRGARALATRRCSDRRTPSGR